MKRNTAAILLTLIVPAILAHCATTEKPVSQRIADRTFPSVFQAWSDVENVPGDRYQRIAMHDLVWHGVSWFGLQWDRQPTGLSEALRPDSVERALAFRQRLLQLNPNLILIAEIRYRDAHRSFLASDHEWWARDPNGRIDKGWEEGGYWKLDFSNPSFQDHVARRARAVVVSGVVDGIMLDWWRDGQERLSLIEKVRAAIGEKALIIANANDVKTPHTAPCINGYFMECYRTNTVKDWQRIADTLTWASQNLREPRINCLETWYHKSRSDLNLMRATTTLSLTHSDGYCLFSDPNPLPTGDHLHNWYDFWNKSLGRPLADASKRDDGSTIRPFERGWAIYNPIGGKPVAVEMTTLCCSLATGRISQTHSIEPCDGDILLKVQQ